MDSQDDVRIWAKDAAATIWYVLTRPSPSQKIVHSRAIASIVFRFMGSMERSRIPLGTFSHFRRRRSDVVSLQARCAPSAESSAQFHRISKALIPYSEVLVAGEMIRSYLTRAFELRLQKLHRHAYVVIRVFVSMHICMAHSANHRAC